METLDGKARGVLPYMGNIGMKYRRHTDPTAEMTKMK